MNKNTTLLALAGLLHDVGKFMLRAAESGTRTWDEEARGDYKYKHAMLTASFIERYVPKQWQDGVKLWAGDHHRPQTAEDRIISLADWLSAAERNDGVEDEQVRKSHPKQLLSIFSNISLDGGLGERQRKEAYLPLSPLALAEEVIFPGPALDESEVWDRYFHALWLPFTTDADALRRAHEPSGVLESYLESLLLLMQRYTWSIPSAYYNAMPDISLYDHSRMTGALAATLADADDEMIASLLNHGPESSQEEVAVLVGGDISGVQDFLYTITNRGATSALRGRSFYLQLLTEAIARYVLRELDLPITNLIYQGGGNFYILARASDAARLEPLRRDISRTLLQYHQGDLYVALAGVPLQAQDFYGGNLSGKWGELAERQQKMKLQRFSELDDADLCWLFQPLGDGGNADEQCQVCGREHKQTKPIKRRNGAEVRVCPSCLSYEDLGRDLRKARYLAIEQLPKDAPPPTKTEQAAGKYDAVLAAFGMKAMALEDLQDVPNTKNSVTLLAIKDDALDDLRPGPAMAVGRRFLVNVTPILSEEEYHRLKESIEERYFHRKDGSWPDPVKPFSVLTAQSSGIKRLGALRMDVDNLGKLFSEGLGDKATLSRVAGLSFAFSLFFEGWVEHLAENRQKPSANGDTDRLYSIYSGGDDLFFVGSWDAVVDFARQVRADLGRYAAGHPAIHASGGIVLVGGKYPLAQAARDAGEAEHAAKSYQRWIEDREKMMTVKDAISFLGQVQSWKRFGLNDEPGLETVSGLAALLGGMDAPKSLVRTLSRLYAQYAVAERKRAETGDDENLAGKPQPLWGPWMWRGYYTLRRAKGAEIRKLADILHDDDFKSMAWMGLATRWAELSTR